MRLSNISVVKSTRARGTVKLFANIKLWNTKSQVGPFILTTGRPFVTDNHLTVSLNLLNLIQNFIIVSLQ